MSTAWRLADLMNAEAQLRLGTELSFTLSEKNAQSGWIPVFLSNSPPRGLTETARIPAGEFDMLFAELRRRGQGSVFCFRILARLDGGRSVEVQFGPGLSRWAKAEHLVAFLERGGDICEAASGGR